MVFNESMKRPLEQLRLKWNGSNNIQESLETCSHTRLKTYFANFFKPKLPGGCGRPDIGKYGQSHQLSVAKFIAPLSRHSTLVLFISEVTNTETYSRLFPTDTSSFGCPHCNQTQLIYWSADKNIEMPGLLRLKLPDEEIDFTPNPKTVNLAVTNLSMDGNNLPGQIREHFLPGRIFCEPLSQMASTVTVLSICDRLKDLGIWLKSSYFRLIEYLN